MPRSPRVRRVADYRLTRRQIVAGGALAGGGAVALGALLATRRGDEPSARVSFAHTATPPPAVIATAPGPSATTAPSPPTPLLTSTPIPPPDLALEHASVRQLREALDGGFLTSRALVEAAIGRIEAMDRGERGLGAVIELNPDALEIARVRDQELAAGQSRGPLHGIPILLKDLFATADAMATTAGSLAMVDNVVVRDAFVVWRLRQAGAVILGKTNLTEWSNFQGTIQTSGWSARGGQTRNPYHLDRSPWGSSSGSAVAVAAGYVPLALGVETDGSIVCPASAAAVVGMKPTVGLVSRAGIIPISFTQDSPGPMARSVEDVAILLTAIAGFDPEDAAFGELGWTTPATNVSPFPVHEAGAIDYTAFLDPDGLRDARIGVARNIFPTNDPFVDEVLPLLAEAGAEIVDPANIATAGELGPGISEFQVLVTEFAYGLETFLRTYTPGGPMATVADIIAFNESHAEEELRYHDQAVFYRAQTVGTVWDPWYREAAVSNLDLARARGIDAIMEEHALDALIAPTTGAPTPIAAGGENFPGASAQIPAIAGYPIINVPVGYVDGLPVGMSFIGRAFSEPTLLRLAYAFEQLHPVRRPPEYLSDAPG